MKPLKITGGEWCFFLDSTIRNSDCTRVIAKIQPENPCMNQEDLSNGAMIAAAPELYDLLYDAGQLTDNKTLKSEIDLLLAKARG